MKTYKVNYKIFPNEGLKKVNFHGEWISPLYVRITFDRRSTQYKCNLFELFLQPKYAIRVSQQILPPDLSEIIKREENIIESIIDKHPDDFSLDLFKTEYDHYSIDILSKMEPGFLDFLYTFLTDEGMPFLTEALRAGIPEYVNTYEVVQDLRIAFNPPLYDSFIQGSIAYAPPYLPLSKFIESSRKQPYALTVMDCENAELQRDLTTFLKKNYQQETAQEIQSNLSKFIADLSK